MTFGGGQGPRSAFFFGFVAELVVLAFLGVEIFVALACGHGGCEGAFP